MNLIEARELTCRFGDFVAVDAVSFAVAPGEVVGLLGANGAGKTTTIRMLLGLIRPTTGLALLNGGPPNRSNRAQLGYVPQGLGLYPDLTVAENVTFSAQAYGCQPVALPESLAALGDRLVGSLPLGLRRQLAFRCAVQHEPRSLILDEPTSGVEPLARAHLWDEIRAEADRGVAALVTTHYMSEARQCDRLLLLSNGRVVAQGTERDIVAGTEVIALDSDEWARLFSLLADAGYTVILAGRSVRVVDPAEEELRAMLAAQGIQARWTRATATIEERMATL